MSNFRKYGGLNYAATNNIVRNHNIDGIDKDDFKKMYIDATSEPRNFFMLDCY
jgi:hypothetical protein